MCVRRWPLNILRTPPCCLWGSYVWPHPSRSGTCINASPSAWSWSQGPNLACMYFSTFNMHLLLETDPVTCICSLRSLCCRLVLGFMCCTVFLSMWLSNTSTTAMVMPIAEAVLQQLICTGIADNIDDSATVDTQDEESGESKRQSENTCMVVMHVLCFL